MKDPRNHGGWFAWWGEHKGSWLSSYRDICARLDAKDAEIERLKEESRAWSIGKANVVKELEEAEAEIAAQQHITEYYTERKGWGQPPPMPR